MLRYVLRVNGREIGYYHTIEEAVDRTRHAVAIDADLDPEIIDARTGRACMVAASKRWRDEIAERIGA
ncbi:MAG: hypothetical protein M3Y41_07495 [Pseudomonadota bacterium]|nr:hypothetical protein [Pseudomonadota bacterium]